MIATVHNQAHLQFTRANAKAKNCKRACSANARKKKQRNANSIYFYVKNSSLKLTRKSFLFALVTAV